MVVVFELGGTGYSLLVPDESRSNWISRMPMQAGRWFVPSLRKVWLLTLVALIVACAVVIANPSKWPALLYCLVILTGAVMMTIDSRRGRRDREALATRLATRPRDDIPAQVIELLLAGKKIQAIKSYQELTSTSLKEAKALIDSL